MTRAEIEKSALGLPIAERAALIETLTASLLTEGGLSKAEEVEFQALRARIEPLLEAAFEGKAEEWGDEEWAALLRGEYKYPPDPDSQAVPPGWTSPRLHQNG